MYWVLVYQACFVVGNITKEGLESFQEGKNGNCLDFYQGIFQAIEGRPESQHEAV